jgi:ankyrin repeat protein
MRASSRGHTAIVQLLLDHGAQVNIQNDEGWTTLMHASIYCHAETCLMLLQHGARIDIQDNDGRTALMLAVLHDKFGVIQVLMEHKALLLSDDATLETYSTQFSTRPSISTLVKREQNWRRRKPWLLFWLALRRSVVVARSGTRARKKEGNLARPVLTLDFVGRKVASYL